MRSCRRSAPPQSGSRHCDRWRRCLAALEEMSHGPSTSCDCNPSARHETSLAGPARCCCLLCSATTVPPASHICTGTGSCICIKGSPLPHLHRDRSLCVRYVRFVVFLQRVTKHHIASIIPTRPHACDMSGAHPRGAHRSEALRGLLCTAPGRARAERDQQRWPVKDKAFVVRLDTESFSKEVEFIRQSGPHARTCTLARTHARTHRLHCLQTTRARPQSSRWVPGPAPASV